jgi:hypothetical protein
MKMGNIKSNSNPIDTTAIEAEMNAAKGGGPRRGGATSYVGKSTKGIVIEAKDLPRAVPGKPDSGKVTFRILPPLADMTMPWVRYDGHFFFHEGTRQWAGFNCLWRMTNGAQQCPGCDFIQRLNRQILWPLEKLSEADQKAYMASHPEHRGAKKMAGSKAKTTLAMNVVFTSWEGGPVPKEYQGVRVLKVGGGIWKGTERGQVGGLVKILQDNPNLCDEANGPMLQILKSGEDLETTYVISVLTAPKTAVIDGESVTIQRPVLAPLAPTEAEIKALLEARAGLSIFLRMKTTEEAEADIQKVDTFTTREAPKAPAPVSRPAPAPQRTAQEDLDTEFGKTPAGDDDIPW